MQIRPTATINPLLPPSPQTTPKVHNHTQSLPPQTPSDSTTKIERLNRYDDQIRRAIQLNNDLATMFGQVPQPKKSDTPTPIHETVVETDLKPYQNYLDNKANIQISEVVPGKLPWYEKSVDTLHKRAGVKPISVVLSEKGFKSTGTFADTSMVLSGSLNPSMLEAVKIADFTGSAIGILNTAKMALDHHIQPEKITIPDLEHSEPDANTSSGASLRLWQALPIPVRFSIDTTIIAHQFLHIPLITALNATALPLLIGLGSAKLIIDGMGETINKLKQERNPENQKAILTAPPAIASAVGSFMLTGSMTALLGHPVGWLIVASGLGVACTEIILRNRMNQSKQLELIKKLADIQSGLQPLEEIEKLTLDEFTTDPRTAPLYELGLIEPSVIQDQLHQHGITDTRIITNQELILLAITQSTLTQAKDIVQDEDTANSIKTQLKSLLADYITSHTVLLQVESLEQSQDEDKQEKRTALIETQFFHQISQNKNINEPAKEALTLSAIKGTYQEMPINRDDLKLSKVKINELFLPLTELKQISDRPINVSSNNPRSVLLSHFNLKFKHQHLKLQLQEMKSALLKNLSIKTQIKTGHSYYAHMHRWVSALTSRWIQDTGSVEPGESSSL